MPKLSPCNAAVWTHCPASILFLEKSEAETGGFAATNNNKRLGRAAHLLAANAMRGYFNLWDGVYTKRYIRKVDRPPMEAAARWYKKQVLAHTTSDMIGFGIESTIGLESIIHQRGAMGKIDYFAYNADHIVVFDYKYGAEPIAAKWNHQLWLYAAGILANKTWWHGSKVSVVVVQPALKTVRKQTLPADRVRKLAQTYTKKADKALSQLQLPPELATYKPLKSVCMWCRGEAHCLALKKEKEKQNESHGNY